MDKKLYGILILLISSLIFCAMVEAVSAQSQTFSIYAYDSYGNPASNAYITVYQGAYEVKHDSNTIIQILTADGELNWIYTQDIASQLAGEANTAIGVVN